MPCILSFHLSLSLFNLESSRRRGRLGGPCVRGKEMVLMANLIPILARVSSCPSLCVCNLRGGSRRRRSNPWACFFFVCSVAVNSRSLVAQQEASRRVLIAEREGEEEMLERVPLESLECCFALPLRSAPREDIYIQEECADAGLSLRRGSYAMLGEVWLASRGQESLIVGDTSKLGEAENGIIRWRRSRGWTANW